MLLATSGGGHAGSDKATTVYIILNQLLVNLVGCTVKNPWPGQQRVIE